MIDLKEVIEFATEAHKGQYYGIYPYTTHLSDVYRVLIEFGIKDIEIISSAWLHDIIEDTENNYNDIKSKFGKEVAEIVYAVTDEMGRNRNERHEKTYPKIRNNEKAIILKQGDILANWRQGIFECSDMLPKYKKEYPNFRNWFHPMGNEKLWKELDKLYNLNEKE